MKIAAIIAFALAIAPDAAHAAGIRVFADQADTARAMEGEEVLSICNSNCQHSMDGETPCLMTPIRRASPLPLPLITRPPVTECYDDSMGNNHNDGKSTRRRSQAHCQESVPTSPSLTVFHRRMRISKGQLQE